MTFIKSHKKFEYLSNVLLGLFFILVMSSALLTDIFRSPTKSNNEKLGNGALFLQSEFQKINKISLKNKSGLYVIEKLDQNQISPWEMVTPRKITANSVFIEKLFLALSTMKIKNVFSNDQINNANFSLEKSNATLILENKEEQKSLIIDIGLKNSIDNTTYIKVSSKNNIYQVEVPTVSLEDATILELIESKIFSIDLENITSFKIEHLIKKISNPLMEIIKKDSNWVAKSGNLVTQEKLDVYFQDLSTIKSTFVLDSVSDLQKQLIETLSKKPEYIMTIMDTNNNLITYKISSLIYNFPDLELKNSAYFLVTISNNQTAYLVKKEFFELFSKQL